MVTFQQAKTAFIEWCKLTDAGDGGTPESLKEIRIWNAFVHEHDFNATALAVVFGCTHYAKFMTIEKDFLFLRNIVQLFEKEASQLSKDLLCGKVSAKDFEKIWSKNHFVE